MSRYSIFLNEIINNIKNYNLYFAIIKLALLGLDTHVTKYKFNSDIKYIKSIAKLELNSWETAILDINDGVHAFTDEHFALYKIEDLNKLIRDF